MLFRSVDSYPLEQVGIWRENNVALTLFPYIIEKIAYKFNEAYLIVESNSIGKLVTDKLWNELEYTNMYVDIKGNIGLRQTTSTKKIGITKLVENLKSSALKINDFNTIKEMSNFNKLKNSYAASSGHDDIVMTLVNFSFVMNKIGRAHV